MVITNVNQVVYEGDGLTTAFPFTFTITDPSEVYLQLVHEDDTVTTITQDFYVDVTNNTVHYPGYAPGSEPPEANRPPKVQTGEKLVIYRDVPMTQEIDLGDKWPFAQIEFGLDKLTMICQQIYSYTNRKLDAALASMFQLAGIVTDSNKLQHITYQYNAIDANAAAAATSAEMAAGSATAAAASATSAANSANASAGSATSATNTANALVNFLESKETLTAPAVDPTLTISGAAADSMVTGNIANNAGMENDITSVFTFNSGRRINYVNGAVNSGDTYSDMSTSGFININGYNKVRLTRQYVKTKGTATGMAFYSTSEISSFVSGVKLSVDTNLSADTYKIETVPVPSGANYMRTTWWASTTPQYAETPFKCWGIKDGFLQEQSDYLVGSEAEITPLTIEDGKRVNYVLGSVSNFADMSATDFIPVEGYNNVRLTRQYVKTKGTATGMAFYSDEDVNTFISGVKLPYNTDMDNDTYKIETVPVPSNAKYMRTTWWASTTPQYAETPFKCWGVKDGVILSYYNELKDLINSGEKDEPEEVIDVLPDYYYADNYIDSRVSDIQDAIKEGSIHGDVFFWFTDPHVYLLKSRIQNGLQSGKLIKYVKDKLNIKKVFCGGDLVTGTDMAPDVCINNFKKFRNLYAPIWADMYMCIGNHEGNNQSANPDYDANILPVQLVYNLLLKDKEMQYESVSYRGDYWVDNTAQKIRYFFLGATYKALLSSVTAMWFAREMEKVPAGYTVVVLSHLGVKIDLSGTYILRICEILDAAKLRTTYTYLSETYDYSTLDIKIAGVISGHSHIDSAIQTEQGVWVITTTCDRGPTSTTPQEFNDARAFGTIKEQAVDVVVLNTETKTIKMFRVGGSYDGTGELVNPDREFSYAD